MWLSAGCYSWAWEYQCWMWCSCDVAVSWVLFMGMRISVLNVMQLWCGCQLGVIQGNENINAECDAAVMWLSAGCYSGQWEYQCWMWCDCELGVIQGNENISAECLQLWCGCQLGVIQGNENISAECDVTELGVIQGNENISAECDAAVMWLSAGCYSGQWEYQCWMWLQLWHHCQLMVLRWIVNSGLKTLKMPRSRAASILVRLLCEYIGILVLCVYASSDICLAFCAQVTVY